MTNPNILEPKKGRESKKEKSKPQAASDMKTATVKKAAPKKAGPMAKKVVKDARVEKKRVLRSGKKC